VLDSLGWEEHSATNLKSNWCNFDILLKNLILIKRPTHWIPKARRCRLRVKSELCYQLLVYFYGLLFIFLLFVEIILLEKNSHHFKFFN
jgi:hypothetical protein